MKRQEWGKMRKSWAEVSRSGERWAEVRRWEVRQSGQRRAKTG